MLVSVEELRLYMGGFTPEEGLEREMVNILNGVQQQLETYLNRPVEYVQVREVALSDSKGNLYLSVTPVRKIISYGVTVAEPTVPDITPVAYEMEADPLIGDDGRIVDKVYYKSRPYTSWNRLIPFTPYAIEYIAGLDGNAMENIKLAIKRVAAREYANNYIDIAGQRTGDTERIDIGDTRNSGWSNGELKSLERYRRRIAL